MNEYHVASLPQDETMEEFLNRMASYGWRLVWIYENQFIFVREPRA